MPSAVEELKRIDGFDKLPKARQEALITEYLQRNMLQGDTSQPTEQVTPQQEPPADDITSGLPTLARLPARAAVRSVDAIPGAVGTLGGLAVGEASRPFTSPGMDNLSKTLLSPQFTKPLETAVAGEKGFSVETTPALRALQHILDSTGSAAVGGIALGKIAQVIGSGAPLTEQVILQARLGVQGAVAAESVKAAGGAPWMQLVTELVAGGMSRQDAAKVLRTIKARPGLTRFIQETANKQPGVEFNIAESQKAQDLLGSRFNPSLAEQTGSDVIAAGQRKIEQTYPDTYGISAETGRQANIQTMSNKVTDIVESPVSNQNATLEQTFFDIAKPVRQAESELATATGNVEALQATKRHLNAKHTADLRASQDASVATLDAIQVRTDQFKDQIRQANRNAEDAVKASREAAGDVDEAGRLALRQAEDSTQLSVLQAKKKLQGVEDERTVVLRAHEDKVGAAIHDARRTNKTAAIELRTQQDTLGKVSLQNQQDLGTVNDFTKKSIEQVSPEMAGVSPSQRGQLGQEITKKGGVAAQDLEDAAWKRTQGAAKEQYGIVYKQYGVRDSAGPLNDALKMYEEDLIRGVRGTYEPDPALNDIQQKITQRQREQFTGDTLDLSKTPDGDLQRSAVQLTLEDFHDMRSRVLTELRMTGADSPRRATLAKLAGLLDAQTQQIATNFPGAYDALTGVNKWYRGEMVRFNVGPGDYATRINPRTGELAEAPDVVANLTFSAGPTLDRTSKQASENAQNFQRYMRDIDNDLTEAAMTGNLELMWKAQSAQDAIFDVAKAQFYSAAVDQFSGTINPQNAEKWLVTHDTLIKSHPELTKIFRTPQDRLASIRQVEAQAQGKIKVQQENVETAQSVRDVVKDTSEEAVFQARQAETPIKRNAHDELVTAKRGVQDETQTAGDQLTDVRRTTQDAQLVADEATRQLEGQALSTKRAGQDLSISEGLAAKKESQVVRRSIGRVRRAQSDELRALDEELRLANEKQTGAQTAHEGALSRFDENFGGSQAARAALNDVEGTKLLGAEPRAVIRDIESKTNLDDKNRTYAKLFRDIGNNQPAKDAILAAQWQEFLERTGKPAGNIPGQPLLPSAEDLAGFLKEKQVFLRRYFPDYAENLGTIQKAAESANRAHSVSGPTIDVPRQMQERTQLVRGVFDFGTVIVARAFGVSYPVAAALGFGTEMVGRWNNLSKAAFLNEVYFNPQSTKIIAGVLNPKSDPTWKRVVLNNIVRRNLSKSNVLSQQLNEEPLP